MIRRFSFSRPPAISGSPLVWGFGVRVFYTVAMRGFAEGFRLGLSRNRHRAARSPKPNSTRFGVLSVGSSFCGYARAPTLRQRGRHVHLEPTFPEESALPEISATPDPLRQRFFAQAFQSPCISTPRVPPLSDASAKWRCATRLAKPRSGQNTCTEHTA